MNRRITLAAAFLAVSFSSLADPLPEPLARSLAPLDATEARLDAGTLSARLNKPVVTFTAFESFVTNNVCSPLFLDAKAGWGRSKIARVELRNQVGAQGYAVNNARQVCRDIGDIAGGAANVKKYLQPIALVCVAGNECRPRRAGERTSGDE